MDARLADRLQHEEIALQDVGDLKDVLWDPVPFEASNSPRSPVLWEPFPFEVSNSPRPLAMWEPVPFEASNSPSVAASAYHQDLGARHQQRRQRQQRQRQRRPKSSRQRRGRHFATMFPDHRVIQIQRAFLVNSLATKT